jgi:hypothetical protein
LLVACEYVSERGEWKNAHEGESPEDAAPPWEFRTPAVGVAGITSEWWPASVRNGGRFQIGIPAGINSEYLAGMRRNLHTDHLIVLNAEHLRRILAKFATYYNEVRTHVSLEKDAPCTRQIEWFGDIVAHPILGGLHHRYARI